MFNLGDGEGMKFDMGDLGGMFGDKLQNVMKQALKKGTAGSTFTINTDGMDMDIDNLLNGLGSSSGKRAKASSK